ncbi:MAG: ABC transporter ATP-binding protein/permease [Coriobacteriaceae bacterium]|nr:ABC transporter ATP-binding protein/permease [Coriobacteriaceae bacterium]
MIEIRDLRKSYNTGGFVNKALDGVNITFRDNEFVAVLGPSGSGKTTLLNVLGGLDHADSGDIIINGVSTKNYKSSDWDTYRNHRIGFVFQSYNLIPHQSVLANVELALTLANVGRAERQRRAKAMLQKVGLGDHISKKPNQLSGGQKQRVAIARALVNDPDILLADEPTGALDTETGIQVMDLLSEVAKDRLVIMVTHNPELAQTYANRIVNFSDGKVVGDSNPLANWELAAAAAEIASGGRTAIPRAARVAATTTAATAAGAMRAAAAEASRGKHAASAVPPQPEAPQAGFAARENADKSGKASMGFLTALSLSFNNLMTKKGRTFLTAFAGSIGIIGIAAILALSNGVNAYIADTEEEALAAYPLTITKSSFDMANLMTGMSGYASADEEGEGDEEKGKLIPQSSIMTDMFAKVKNNDLKAFKKWIDDGGDGIWEYVNDIEYDYGITPIVYKSDTSKLVKLNPSYMSSVFSNGLNTSSLMSMSGGFSAFQEMLEDRNLVESQMEVVKGRWPEKYDEAVVVLSRRGKISDYSLYSLGVLDPKKMEDMTKQALNGEDVDVPDDHVDFTYDDALDLTFKVVPTALTYKKNEDQGTWTDMSKDTAFMRDILRGNAINLKIVGIVKAREDASTVMLTEGVAYTKDLTYHLMKVAAESQIVREQKADRDVDVFTGKTFDELQDEQGNNFDLENVFSVDEEALRNAFSFDTSAFESLGDMDLDLSGIQMDPNSMKIDPNAMDIDPSALSSAFSEDTMKKIMQNAPKFEFQPAQDASQEETSDEGESASDDGSASDGGSATDGEGADGANADGEETADQAQSSAIPQLPISDEQQAQITEAANSVAASFTAWLLTAHPEVMAQMATPGAQIDTAALFAEFLQANPEAQQTIAGITSGLTEAFQTQMNDMMQDYMVNQFAPYLATAMQTIMTQAAQTMATSMAQAMASQMAEVTNSLGSTLGQAISGQLGKKFKNLSTALQDGFSVDANAFANAIQFNMTQEDLTSLLTNYMNADELTYDGNLTKLGFASKDNPNAISIYSKNFPAKEAALDLIDGYNDKVSAGGDDSETIQYSDIAGVLMSSVTDIVDTISLVLIAFVSISLVVSSIMIAIVTYISVLERKKEIGVLRAMGASRGNIANVFNAETIIEGFIAGVFAIAVVLAASVPVNQIILETQGVPNVMQLPWDAAAILIGISVLLTFVAGLIPSQKAAHADPVEALRSE